jgi:hypothetical protein
VCVVDSCGSGLGLLAGSNKHDNELAASIKCEELLV